jgi:beta-glucanase (GH16 family)
MLQGWNMMCFTGGLIEVAVTIPGAPDVRGFWPAVWMMGNLGRVGYGGTTDGLVRHLPSSMPRVPHVHGS